MRMVIVAMIVMMIMMTKVIFMSMILEYYVKTLLRCSEDKNDDEMPVIMIIQFVEVDFLMTDDHCFSNRRVQMTGKNL